MDVLSIDFNNIGIVSDYTSYENLQWQRLPYNLLVVESEKLAKIARNILYEIQYGFWKEKRHSWLTDNTFKIVIGNETKFYSQMISRCALDGCDFKTSKKYKTDYFWNNEIGDATDFAKFIEGTNEISYKALWNYIADAMANAEEFPNEILKAIEKYNIIRIKNITKRKEEIFNEKIYNVVEKLAVSDSVRRGNNTFDKYCVYFDMPGITTNASYGITVELKVYDDKFDRAHASVSINGVDTISVKLDMLTEYLHALVTIKDAVIRCKW